MANDPSAKNKRSSSAKDLYIAKKLRERRIEIGLNQSDLANMLGVTYQQVHKYEKGIDRIPAGRLFEFSKILSVPLSFFDEEGEGEISPLAAKNLVVTCANMQKRKVRLKFLKLRATLTDIKTQEEYDVEIS
ncbi:helix-turn-helix domain-containing protein [Candidatus Paracaedibacter symbiosus]|uniref:helix-turn-helix domain-containing protein n=1 Tax=Candidatus Paracaedibacter symbiosus TaxID=244582 RepID=UPI00068B6F58|nr:helix-turn-helix transcriptional regulator [Candidatus Paracaedibacter symbiosus]